jgi:hypothetical protein
MFLTIISGLISVGFSSPWKNFIKGEYGAVGNAKEEVFFSL